MNALQPLVGEPLAIDLVNTVTAQGDLLTSPEALGAWLALEAERHPRLEGAADRHALEATRAVREHATAAFTSLVDGRRPPDSSLRGLAAAVNAAPGRTRLAWNGTEVTVSIRREGTAAERLSAELAQAAVDLLADPAVMKVRRCGAEDCVLLFLPAHPRRQWCSPDRCGNRVRVARHYRRSKAER